MSYTALNYDTELKSTAESFDKEKSHKLPDGGIIAFAAQRFRCPEVLFQLSFIGKETSGVRDTSFQSIMKCDVDIRRDLCANVVLSGDTSTFQGIGVSLTKELTVSFLRTSK